jgi:hypothetical protein
MYRGRNDQELKATLPYPDCGDERVVTASGLWCGAKRKRASAPYRVSSGGAQGGRSPIPPGGGTGAALRTAPGRYTCPQPLAAGP